MLGDNIILSQKNIIVSLHFRSPNTVEQCAVCIPNQLPRQAMLFLTAMTSRQPDTDKVAVVWNQRLRLLRLLKSRTVYPYVYIVEFSILLAVYRYTVVVICAYRYTVQRVSIQYNSVRRIQ